jgi:hypothetical protein
MSVLMWFALGVCLFGVACFVAAFTALVLHQQHDHSGGGR